MTMIGQMKSLPHWSTPSEASRRPAHTGTYGRRELLDYPCCSYSKSSDVIVRDGRTTNVSLRRVLIQHLLPLPCDLSPTVIELDPRSADRTDVVRMSLDILMALEGVNEALEQAVEASAPHVDKLSDDAEHIGTYGRGSDAAAGLEGRAADMAANRCRSDGRSPYWL